MDIMENTVSSISCKLCNKKFSQKSSLNRHVREQHFQPGFYRCNQCGLRFSKKYNLQIHMKHVHSKNLNQLKCTLCTATFTKLATLKNHYQVHANCTTTISSGSNLDLVDDTDAQILAESVLKELKQLQEELEPLRELTAIERRTIEVITIKDTLYPLGHFTFIQTQAIKRRNGVQYLICEFCGKECRKTYNFLRHRRIHTKVRPFVCVLCKKSFPTTAQLKTHCSTHKLHEQFGVFSRLYKCPKCNEGFRAVRDLDKHICSEYSNCSVTFKCAYCFKSYNTLKSLLQHSHIKRDNELEMLKKILPSPLAVRKQCNFCGILVNEGILLNQHKKRHENLFMNQCAKCQCSFVTQTALKAHTKVHLNEKKFKCHYCSKCFQTQQSCRRHMLNHLKLLLDTYETSQDKNDSLFLYSTFIKNENRFQIETTSTPIIKSRKNCKVKNEANFKSKELKYKCSECEKSFRYKAWLNKHFKYKHTTDLPYECSSCLRKFRTKQSLQSHRIVHSTKRLKVTCQVCGRQYASSKSLNVHLRIHTQETPFRCDKCSTPFRTSGHLIQHRKSNHHI